MKARWVCLQLTSTCRDGLKIQVRGLQNALVFLKKQFSECDYELLDEPVTSNKTNQALITLADSITSRGTVPTSSHSSHSSRRSSRAPTDSPSGRPSSRPPVTARVPLGARSPNAVPNNLRTPKVTFRADRHPNDSKGTKRSKQRRFRQSDGSTVGSTATSGYDHEDETETSDEESYDYVRPKNYLLYLQQGDNIQCINGLVNDRSVTAIVNGDLDVNLISQAFALKHGIQVKPLNEFDEDTETTFDFGKGRLEPKIGNASFKWNEGSRRDQSFTVNCSVCRHEIRPIILGRPFIQKRIDVFGKKPNSP